MTISWANFEKLFQYGTMFQQGMIVTILLAACTVFFGFILAFLLALMLLSDVRPFRHLEKIKTDDIHKKKRYDRIAAFNPVRLLANAYVQFVRCTPMLVQIFLVYYIIFGFVTCRNSHSSASSSSSVSSRQPSRWHSTPVDI